MEYYFYLTNGRTHTFWSYFDAKKFYENNSLNVVETNFNYEQVVA